MEKKKTNGLCLAGFIVSLVSLLINLYGAVGITGLVLSIVGLNALNEAEEGRGLAIAGIVVGCISIAYAFIIILALM